MFVHHNPSPFRWLLFVALSLVVSWGLAPVRAAETPLPKERIERWLVLGPIPVPWPAFRDEEPTKVGSADLLDEEHVPLAGLEPEEGSHVSSFQGPVKWTVAAADTGGVGLGAPPAGPAVAYLAAYLEAPRWMTAEIEVRSAHPVELFIDGISRIEKKSPRKADAKPSEKATVKLPQGKHTLVVKTVSCPDDSLGEWKVDVRLSPGKRFREAPRVSLDPERKVTIGDVLEAPQANEVLLSPDGAYVAIRMSKVSPPEGKREEWVEVRRLDNARLVETFRDLSEASHWQWAPTGHRLSYTTKRDEAFTLRVYDLDTGEVSSVLEGVKDLSGYAWSPDGNVVVYSVEKKAEKEEAGVKRIREVRDRQEGARDETRLYLASVPGRTTRRLTAGRYSAFVYGFHPDGRSVLVGRTYEDLSQRPYNATELVRLDLETHKADVLWTGRFLGDAIWSPDGKKILVTAGPSSFGDVGLDVPEGTTPNDYDTQAYLFDPVSKSVDPITKDFDPTIVRAFWPRRGGEILFVAEEADYVRLFRYDTRSRSFRRIELPCDVIHSADAARENGAVVLVGSSANRPARLYALQAGRSRGREFLDYAADRFRHVRTGKVEDWDFVSRSGRRIVGRVHYPPDFDPSRTWPCIVYYYGGTSPVDRSFGGRYPKDLWAAHGYVVYVLQPSGATGFGQEFSAAHVNDWGEVTSGEIIEGTKKFLAAHPFVDPHRVGCIGASFGGFMTQLVVSRTDIFSAAVSHAGISSISSYWGEGYWGYDYNAVSAANSFPWNRRDIYVDRSPLFAADKIETPLLLLHGTADTNVPPGESEQMYTALKLLGREVEYLRVEGQNHFVLDYKKRIVWSDAILAWFDKWLKDEPEWWDDTYPPVDKPGKKRPKEIGLEKAQLDRYGTVLFGEVSREDIAQNIPGWDAEYDAYRPDSAAVATLRERLRGVRLVCVFGTWCSDSRREVPRLWKVLDEAGFPRTRLRMLAVGSTRFGPEMPISKEALEWSADTRSWYDVAAVATIIVSRGGHELGRIVENPEVTLEADLCRFLEGTK